jgi:hypothetical protein
MPDVTVKLTLGTFSTEITGPSDYVDKKLDELINRFLVGSKSSVPEVPAATTVASAHGGKELSPAEFIKKVNPHNQVDTGLLLGYYLEKTRNMSSFTSTELSDLGKEIRRPFTNSSDIVAKLTSRGLIMSAGGKGGKEGQRAYALTATGEQYVESLIEPKLK